ncbi:MAG: hypothetical protein EXS48_03455 [Candidatus Staskawiczbacteria bacterium]|nr:hypothetical protein [Candidatus Staskawiczbacteria bacterium]
MKKLKPMMIPVVILVVVLGLAWWWLADRESDVPAPDRTGLIFDPTFGPKTPAEAKEYVEERVKRSWRGMFLKDMKPADLESSWAKQLRAEAIETLQGRWGLTPNMTQEEIDVAREEARLQWAYLQQTKTIRFKARGLLGMNN